jgi:heme/copper-type cytochrome/quinol oxidase subunit 2
MLEICLKWVMEFKDGMLKLFNRAWNWVFRSVTNFLFFFFWTVYAPIATYRSIVWFFVFYMLVSCILNFNQWASSLPAPDVRYNAKIETIWTIVPTLILLLVVVPAFSLIYSMDDNSSQPLFSVKIAGNQWYWTYEYVFLKNDNLESDSLDLVKPQDSKVFSFPYVFPSGLDDRLIVLHPRKWNTEWRTIC